VAVAVATGVPPEHWIDDTRALATAIGILNEQRRR
jgi:hypothetical protein